MNQKVQRSKLKPQDSPKDRILRCALREFSRHGYAGGRVERIARQAGISKRMLFYYFRSKQRLFEIVIDLASLEGERLQPPGSGPVELSPSWSSFHMNNAEWTRLLGWEGLEWKKGSLARQKDRRIFWKRQLQRFKKSVNTRDWPAGTDVSFILFGLVAMEIAPVLLPNLAQLIVKKDISQPASQEKWVIFMRSLCENLKLKKARVGSGASPGKKGRR